MGWQRGRSISRSITAAHAIRRCRRVTASSPVDAARRAASHGAPCRNERSMSCLPLVASSARAPGSATAPATTRPRRVPQQTPSHRPVRRAGPRIPRDRPHRRARVGCPLDIGSQSETLRCRDEPPGHGCRDLAARVHRQLRTPTRTVREAEWGRGHGAERESAR